MVIGYTVKSISEEGSYFLVNGWQKNKTFWMKPKAYNPKKHSFKTERSAKSSLTKLLKVMDDYLEDTMILVRIEENENGEIAYNEIALLRKDGKQR